MTLLSYGLRQRLLLAVQVVLLLTLGGLVVGLGDRSNRRFDLTPTQAHVISQQSKGIVASLTEPVRALVFYDGRDTTQRRLLADVLDQFAAVTSLFSYEIYDLDRTPGLAKKYEIANYNTGVVESRDRVEPLQAIDEVGVARALLAVSRERRRTLCFLVGHGEKSPQSIDDRQGYSNVAKNLEGENFVIRMHDVLPAPADLDTCTAVVSAGPQRDFFADELQRLEAFLRGGGQLLLLVDPDAPASVIAFLERFGVRAGNDLVVDQRNRLYGADAFMPRVPIFDGSTFRKNLDTAAIFTLARTVAPADPPPEGVRVDLVALSSPDSWARIDAGVPDDRSPEFRQGIDAPGPLPVAVMAILEGAAARSGGNGPRTGRLAVFGDSDFASNLYLNLLGNKDLFMSMVGVLAEDDELVAVRQKDRPEGSFSPIYLTAVQGQIIFWSSVVVVPALVLLVGMLVVVRRQRQGR